MMTSDFIKTSLARYSVITLAIIFLKVYISNFIIKYLGFISQLGNIGSYIINFLSIMIILILGDWITKKIFGT